MTTIAILSFFGGVMLLLYGIRLVGEGLQRATGARLRSFLLLATGNRFKALAVGALMTLSQTMGVILGADIGTTLTVQIIAFKVYDYALFMTGIGILMRFLSKSETSKDLGRAILGGGFIFLSLHILVQAFYPLTQNALLTSALLGMSKDPVAGIIISALVTALLHSSAATLGLAITAGDSGFLTLHSPLPP